MSYNAGTAWIKVGPSMKTFASDVKAYITANLRPVSVQVIADVDVTEAKAHLEDLTRPRSAMLGVDVDDAAARGKMDFLSRPRSTTLNVDADTGAATAKLTALGGLASSIGSLGALGGLGGVLAAPVGAVALGGGGAVGSGLLGAGGGLLGFGASLIGNIKSVTDAQKALETAQKQGVTAAAAEASAQNGVASALTGLRSSQEAVTTARISAARAEASAEQGLAQARVQAAQATAAAEQQLTAAQQSARSAQEALNTARETAREQLAGLEDSLRGTALAESGAALAVQQAQLNLQQVQANPAATALQIAQAVQALKEAQLQSDEAADANKKAQADAASARKAGVAGNDQVVQARQQLAQANQGVVTAEQQLNQVRVQGAQQVAQAEQRLQQARSDGARAVARAQEQVANSQRQVAQAQQQATAASLTAAAAQTAIAKAADQLDSKPIDRFLGKLGALKTGWSGFLRDTAGASLGVADKALGIVTRILPALVPVAKAGARAVGSILDQISQLADGPLGKRTLAFFSTFGGVFIRQFGTVGVNVMKGLLRLFMAFGPTSKSFGSYLVGASKSFADMTKNLGQSKNFQSFLAYIRDNGPKVASVLGSLATFVGRFFVALAPVGGQLLGGLANLLGLLAHAPVPVVLALGVAVVALISPIAAVVLGIAAFVTLFQQANGTLKIVMGVIAGLAVGIGVVVAAIRIWSAVQILLNIILTANPIGLVIIAIAGLVGGLIVAYKTSKTFRDIVNTVWTDVRSVVSTVVSWFVNTVVPFFSRTLPGFFSDGWKRISGTVSGAWKDIKGFVSTGLHDVADFFRSIGQTISRVWGDIWGGIKSTATDAINLVIGVLNKLIDGINFLGKPFGLTIQNIEPLGSGTSKGGANTSQSGRQMGGALATGGFVGDVLPGYTPGRDVHRFIHPTLGALDLSGGEPVMRPEFGVAVGHDWIHGANRAARTGGVGGVRRFLGLATGGIFRPIGSAGQLSGNGIHDEYTGFAALDYGAPVGTPIHAVAPGRVTVSRDIFGDQVGGYASYGRYIQVLHNGFETLYAHLSQRGVGQGALVPAGGLLGLSGDTGHTYGAHLHHGVHGRSPYDFSTASTDYSNAYGSSGDFGLLGSAGSGAASVFSALNPLDYLKDKIAVGFDKAGNWLSTDFGQMIKRIPSTLATKAATYIGGLAKKAATGLIDPLAGSGEGVPIASGVSGYAGIVQKVLAELNPPQLPFLGQYVLQRMMQESGGNATVVNKWDSNWAAGTPSVGLMQVIGPTFDAYAGPFRNTGPFLYGVSTNPEANIYAGLNYALHRYGGLYEPMTQPGGYDQGGAVDGMGLFKKLTPRREWMLKPDESDALQDWLRDQRHGPQPSAVDQWAAGYAGSRTTQLDHAGIRPGDALALVLHDGTQLDAYVQTQAAPVMAQGLQQRDRQKTVRQLAGAGRNGY